MFSDDQDGPSYTEPATPWWENPASRPTNWSGPWPPPLPPGASYGAAPGSVVYAPNAPGPAPTDTFGSDQPAPSGDYNPQWWDKNAVGGGGATESGYGGGSTGTGGSGGVDGAAGAGGSLFDPFPQKAPSTSTGGYQPPAAPSLEVPRMQAPGPWSYEGFKGPGAFTAPTGDEVAAEPGYAFRQGEGLKGITNERAAQGLLRSGGTLKDFATWNQNYASNEYSNTYNRRAQEYDRTYQNLFDQWRANRQNSLDAYTTNFGMARDVYDRNRDAGLAEFAPRLHEWDQNVAVGQHNADQDWQHQFDTWNQNYRIWDDQRRWRYGVLDNERNTGLGTY